MLYEESTHIYILIIRITVMIEEINYHRPAFLKLYIKACMSEAIKACMQMSPMQMANCLVWTMNHIEDGCGLISRSYEP